MVNRPHKHGELALLAPKVEPQKRLELAHERVPKVRHSGGDRLAPKQRGEVGEAHALGVKLEVKVGGANQVKALVPGELDLALDGAHGGHQTCAL